MSNNKKPYAVRGEPKFKHDCDKCIFLGHYKKLEDFQPCDVYCCKGVFGYSFIARYSDEPSDYFSMCPDMLMKIPSMLLTLINIAMEVGVVKVVTNERGGVGYYV